MVRAIPSRSADTDAEAEGVQLDLLRAATPAQRAGMALSLTATAIALSRRALQRQSPGASEEDIGLRFVELNYGRELAAELTSYLRERQR